MSYCKRKRKLTDTEHCLCCDCCLPPGERTDGRMCPDEVTDNEYLDSVNKAFEDSERAYLDFERRCLDAELRGDPHRFDGCAGMLGDARPVTKHLREDGTEQAQPGGAAFLDECFKARVDYVQGRFPLEDFRTKFREEYARRGLVMIQDKLAGCQLERGMTLEPLHGFIFSSRHHLDIALRLLRRCGFSVMRCREYGQQGEATAYVVQLPGEYLRRHLGSSKAGQVSTGLRSIANVNRDKRQKAENPTLI